MKHTPVQTEITSAATTLTTGQYLTALVLAVTPSALGAALGALASNPNATIADWIAAIPNVGDSTDVNNALADMLNNPLLQPLFNALLASTSVSASDGSLFRDKNGDLVLFNFATLVKNIAMNNS